MTKFLWLTATAYDYDHKRREFDCFLNPALISAVMFRPRATYSDGREMCAARAEVTLAALDGPCVEIEGDSMEVLRAFLENNQTDPVEPEPSSLPLTTLHLPSSPAP